MLKWPWKNKKDNALHPPGIWDAKQTPRGGPALRETFEKNTCSPHSSDIRSLSQGGELADSKGGLGSLQTAATQKRNFDGVAQLKKK